MPAMAFDLRSRHGGDVTHAGRSHGASMDAAKVPGKRSAAAELYEADAARDDAGLAAPGGAGRGGGKPPMFAGSVAWEDIRGEDGDEIDGEDPMAAAEARQPEGDEEAETAPADEEGELDADSEGEDDEAGDEPPAPEALASEPAQASGEASQAPSGGNAHGATAGRREGDREARQPQAAAAAAGKSYHVKRKYKDGPYRGTAEYDVRVTAKDITMVVGVRLTPQKGVSSNQVKQVKSQSQAIFKQKYDGRFKLTEIPYLPRPLRMRVRFGHPNPHHNVALHKGGGRDNAAKWYVKGDATTRAHEIGHLLGLKDEYKDPASPKRKVYTDNSLMGNYYAEGIKTASLKKRHGKVFARDISRASGRKFHVSA
jgi:hypothetical protein